MSLESRDQINNTLILGAERFIEGRRQGVEAEAQLKELREAQRRQYLARNAGIANESEILEALKDVDKGYTDKTLYMDTESDKLVQEDLATVDKDNDPVKY